MIGQNNGKESGIVWPILWWCGGLSVKATGWKRRARSWRFNTHPIFTGIYAARVSCGRVRDMVQRPGTSAVGGRKTTLADG